MTLKNKLESLLRNYPPLFRFGSRIYHAMNMGFKSLSPGAPGAIDRAFQIASQQHGGELIGDYYEFGLYKGYTFYCAFKAAQKLGLDQTRFYGFDSFQGLPQVEDVDKTGGRFFEGQFACTREQVEKNLRRYGVDFDRIKLVEGFYEKTLTEQLKSDLGAGYAGVVLFDCDLYSSTRVALDWLQDLIADKTVLVFDDWYSFTEGQELGQQRALKEFMQKNKYLELKPVMEFERNGKMFLVHEQS
ncbi:MAG: TylF/MycF family methyltransferase [Actinomycetia bacterium]|nr:TylF/MycF family methyltransferase [Actinomycetes bacterium]